MPNIRPLGAQLLIDPLGLLYQSPLPPAEASPARGGVPVLFPQFADQGPLIKHGFARRRLWTPREQQAHEACWQLRGADGGARLSPWGQGNRV